MAADKVEVCAHSYCRSGVRAPTQVQSCTGGFILVTSTIIPLSAKRYVEEGKGTVLDNRRVTMDHAVCTSFGTKRDLPQGVCGCGKLAVHRQWPNVFRLNDHPRQPSTLVPHKHAVQDADLWKRRRNARM